MTNIKKLKLSGNDNITIEGLRCLKNLRELYINSCDKIKKEELKVLEKENKIKISYGSSFESDREKDEGFVFQI